MHRRVSRSAEIPNLGMMLPTEWDVRINLRSMVGFVSMMKPVGQPKGTSGFRNGPAGEAFMRNLQPDMSPNENISSQLPNRRPPIANLGIDMPKAHLRLILCSDDIGPEARRGRRDRSFRPSVIDGGTRAIAGPAGDPWEALLELFDLTLLVSLTNYLAFVTASVAALEHHGWADFQAGRSNPR